MTTAQLEYDATEFSLANFRRFICGITATDTDDATRPASCMAGCLYGLWCHLVIRLTTRHFMSFTPLFATHSHGPIYKPFFLYGA